MKPTPAPFAQTVRADPTTDPTDSMSNTSKGDEPSFDPPYEVDPPNPPRPKLPDGKPIRPDSPDPKGDEPQAGDDTDGGGGDRDDEDDESPPAGPAPARVVERHGNTILGPLFEGFIRDVS